MGQRRPHQKLMFLNGMILKINKKIWDVFKAVFREKFIALNTFNIKE